MSHFPLEPLTPEEKAFVDMVVEIGALVRRVGKGYRESCGMTGHDAAKRLYRMGYRKVAEPELDRCTLCGEMKVTSQAICIDCLAPER
jgi:hypothetical protein